MAQTIKGPCQGIRKRGGDATRYGRGETTPLAVIYPETTGGSTTLMEGDGIVQVSHPLLVVKERGALYTYTVKTRARTPDHLLFVHGGGSFPGE